MRYIAFLRGINVGASTKVSMPRLKACFKLSGLEEVRTYINSGNVIFSSKEDIELNLRKKIERAIEHEFGVAIPTLVVSAVRLRDISEAIETNWRNNSDQKTDVIFLFDDVDPQKAIQNIETSPGIDELIAVENAIIWHIERKNYAKSGMHGFIKNPLYKKSTTRNCNTVRKLDGFLRG